MSDTLADFERFMKRRIEAADAYVRGDAAPLGAMVAQELPATFFSPRGDATKGAPEVAERYQRDAQSFEPGGSNKIEVLQMATSGDVAYWVGFQRARARIKGAPEAQSFDLRVTEIFRREKGGWKLVHRHADVLK
jgi:ketosteroid isomerase-like protein